MRRRRFLGVAGAGVASAVAGCTGLVETTYGRAPPTVADRPDAVYHPTHSEGMRLVGTAAAGDRRVALSYSYPHRFWVVEKDGDGYVSEKLDVGRDDAVHLMATVWDPESGQVVPTGGVSVEVTNADGFLTEEVLYPMLSQQMGVHNGDNLPLDGDDAYEVQVTIGGTALNRFGAFEAKFETAATAEFEFEYSEKARNEIPYRTFSDRAGGRGALELMDMPFPVGKAPETLPGVDLGGGESGDARFRAVAVDAERFGPDPYLAVTAQTPFNGLELPGMALAATVEQDGTTLFDGRLERGLDPELGYHYGAPVEGLGSSPELRVEIEVPPTVARHEGYETAFLDMPPTAIMLGCGCGVG